jgi:hypothetical protein
MMNPSACSIPPMSLLLIFHFDSLGMFRRVFSADPRLA